MLIKSIEVGLFMPVIYLAQCLVVLPHGALATLTFAAFEGTAIIWICREYKLPKNTLSSNDAINK